RTDPRGPVDRHRRRSLQQVCTDVARIETHVTGRRVFTEFEHELKRRDTFGTVDCGLFTRVEHLAAEGPEDRHEVGDGGVSLFRPHDVTVNLPAIRACTFFLLDCF